MSEKSVAGRNGIALRKTAGGDDKAPVTAREFGRPIGRGEFDAAQFPRRIVAGTLHVEFRVDADIAKHIHYPGAEIAGAQGWAAIRSDRDFGDARQFGEVLAIFEHLREHGAPAREASPRKIGDARAVGRDAGRQRKGFARRGQLLAIQNDALRHRGDCAEFGHALPRAHFGTTRSTADRARRAAESRKADRPARRRTR